MGASLKEYYRNSSGQFAVLLAVFAFPLVLCVGLAVDTALVHNKFTGLQTSLDSASLAAVTPGNLQDSDREAYAEALFMQNFDPDLKVKVEATATGGRIDMQATLERDTFLMGLIGRDTVVQTNRAAAIRTVQDVVCIMTLNDTNEGSLRIEKDAIINAPECSIQVNSRHDNALISDGNYKPVAKKICAHGGVSGNLGVTTQANCSSVPDPYSSLRAPMVNPETDCNFGPIEFGNIASFSEIVDINNVGITRSPGVYCGGLHIYDSSVKFEPGTYIIHDGPLTIGGESAVFGEDLTFIFSGEGSYLYTYDEPTVDFQASNSGKYAGLIFLQDPDSSSDTTSIIKGSADIRLVGTAYFPTQDLFIGGIGVMGADSPAMAFIANNMTLTSDITEIVSEKEEQFQMFKGFLSMMSSWQQGGYLNFTEGLTANRGSYIPPSIVPIEPTEPETPEEGQTFTTTVLTSLNSHKEAGIPPILPRSDAGARLVAPEDPDKGCDYGGDDDECGDD